MNNVQLIMIDGGAKPKRRKSGCGRMSIHCRFTPGGITLSKRNLSFIYNEQRHSYQLSVFLQM